MAAYRPGVVLKAYGPQFCINDLIAVKRRMASEMRRAGSTKAKALAGRGIGGSRYAHGTNQRRL